MLKKILFVIPGFGQGGAQRQCILLLNEFSQKYKDIEIHLLYFYEGVYWPELNKEFVILHKGSSDSMWSLSALLFVYKIINKVQPNILFSWLHSADVFCGIASLFNKNLRWVMAERDSFYPNEFRYNLRKFIGKKASAVACNSASGVDMWRQLGINTKKISCHNNILYRQSVSFPAFPRYDFIYAGRLEAQKNIPILLDVVSRMHIYKWIIVGNGTFENNVQDVATASPEVLSYLPFQKNIFNIYVQGKIFVSLSLHEGTPNTLIENIALGIRVVVSKIDEHFQILGPDYPFYWDPADGVDGAVMVLEKAHQLPSCDYYGYARLRLAEMSPSRVVETYMNLFERISL